MYTLKLDDIPEEGLALSWDEQRESLLAYLGHFPSVDFDFETPLHAEVKIKKIGKSYLIQGSVQVVLHFRCARCLKGVYLSVFFQFRSYASSFEREGL